MSWNVVKFFGGAFAGMEKTLGKRRFYPLLLLVLTLAGAAPLLYPGLPLGHDAGFHLTRIYVLGRGLAHGVFPVWINPDALEGFGYGPGLFYSDLLLYPAGALAAAGMSVVAAYKLFLALLAVATAFSMYHAVRSLGGKAFGAFAAALLYVWSSYYTVDMFTRAALGEVMAFLFVPWCILGLYGLIFDERRRFLAFALGYAGLFYVHSITFVLMALLGGGLIALNYAEFFRDLRRIFSLFCGGMLALLLAAGALFPLLEQLAAVKFNLTTLTMSSPVAEHAVPFMRLFLALPYMKTAHWLPPGIGLILLVVAAQRLRFASMRGTVERFRDDALLAGLFCLVCATNFLPWEGMMRTLAPIQFPWRFYLPATAFLAFGGGLTLEKIAGDSRDSRRYWLCVLLLWCGAIHFANTGYTYAAKIHEKKLVYSFGAARADESATSGLHYLPAGRKKAWYSGRGGVAATEGKTPKEIKVFRPEYGVTRVELSGVHTPLAVNLPLNPYAGYEVKYADGQKSERLTPDFSGGGFRVSLPRDADRVVLSVRYAGTRLQKYSLTASLLALLAAAAWWWLTRRGGGCKRNDNDV